MSRNTTTKRSYADIDPIRNVTTQIRNACSQLVDHCKSVSLNSVTTSNEVNSIVDIMKQLESYISSIGFIQESERNNTDMLNKYLEKYLGVMDTISQNISKANNEDGSCVNSDSNADVLKYEMERIAQIRTSLESHIIACANNKNETDRIYNSINIAIANLSDRVNSLENSILLGNDTMLMVISIITGLSASFSSEDISGETSSRVSGVSEIGVALEQIKASSEIANKIIENNSGTNSLHNSVRQEHDNIYSQSHQNTHQYNQSYDANPQVSNPSYNVAYQTNPVAQMMFDSKGQMNTSHLNNDNITYPNYNPSSEHGYPQY